jgi:hypothetical protein
VLGVTHRCFRVNLHRRSRSFRSLIRWPSKQSLFRSFSSLAIHRRSKLPLFQTLALTKLFIKLGTLNRCCRNLSMLHIGRPFVSRRVVVRLFCSPTTSQAAAAAQASQVSTISKAQAAALAAVKLQGRKQYKEHAFTLLGLQSFTADEIEASYNRLHSTSSPSSPPSSSSTSSPSSSSSSDARKVELYSGIAHLLQEKQQKEDEQHTRSQPLDSSISSSSSSNSSAGVVVASPRILSEEEEEENKDKASQIVKLLFPSSQGAPSSSFSSSSLASSSSSSLAITLPEYKAQVLELAEKLDPRLWNIGLR